LSALPDWIEAPVSRGQNRAAFDCGDADLNRYLQNQAQQNHDRGISRTFVAAPRLSPETVLGFYSISPTEIGQLAIPKHMRMGHHALPGYRLGRLAVDVSVQGQDLGGLLLLAAAKRCLTAARDVGGAVLLIDAKNERAANWYEKFGAIPLEDESLTLVLSLTTAGNLLRERGITW
jgi:GNAT superfamily N-acetyltransferase